MLFFHDGPHAVKALDCARAPLFLRLVDSVELDALDQLDDEPDALERITVYYRIDEPVRGTMCSRHRKKCGCQPLILANYRVYDRQPDDRTARDRAAWREWCMGEQSRAQLWNQCHPIDKMIAISKAVERDSPANR